MNDLPPPPLLGATPSIAELRATLDTDRFMFVPGNRMRDLLDQAGPWPEFDAFAQSWDDLEVDTYMSDQGRYRRRRHGVFEASHEAEIRQLAPRAHFQTLDYNPLNGGVERWFAPLAKDIAEGPVLGTILRFCAALFIDPARIDTRWLIEVHQFRIEASSDTRGQPTPEGMHRDGVDHVLVLMVRRFNIASGTTTIRSIDNRLLDSFTLTDPLDAALLDDRWVYHGVTAVEPLDPARAAFRDVLVVTFRAERVAR